MKIRLTKSSTRRKNGNGRNTGFGRENDHTKILWVPQGVRTRGVLNDGRVEGDTMKAVLLTLALSMFMLGASLTYVKAGGGFTCTGTMSGDQYLYVINITCD